MSSIFDQNSEFLKYLKDKKEKSNLPNQQPANTVEMHIGENGELLKKTEASSTGDAYVLNLKTHAIREPRAPEVVPIKKTTDLSDPKPHSQQRPTTTAPSAKEQKLIEKIQKITTKPTITTNLKGYLWDKFKFAFTTLAIFGVTFVALNWSAYQTVFKGYYLTLTGQEINSPLNEFSDSNLISDNSVYAAADIPKLNLEIAPPGTRIIIPRLGSNVPVISVSDEKLLARNWEGLEKDIQDALKGGVVHYPGTPYPSQSGNVVITGHSSYYPWDPGRFKDVFAVLHQSKIGDEIIIFHEQKKYKYQVTDIKKVLPSEVNVLGDSGDDRLTLITCTPIGTNLKRLIITAKPVK